MHYPISYPGLEGQNLAVKPAGLFGPQLLQNGSPLTKRKGCYTVKNNAGQPVEIKLKGRPFDPVPRVVIGSDTIDLVPALHWYEYVWAVFPILLVGVGGAVGAGLGAAAALTNLKIFRTQNSTIAKYGLSALTSAGAIGAWLILAAMIIRSR